MVIKIPKNKIIYTNIVKKLTGTTLYVSIPADEVKDAGIKVGDAVSVEIKKLEVKQT